MGLGDILMVCVVEMLLKFCVQRERPPYAKQGTFYILPGEWWSFPSGHTLRATYLARRASELFSTSGSALASFPHVLPSLLASWAVLVGWSRVAKGKHSPLDVTAGLIF